MVPTDSKSKPKAQPVTAHQGSRLPLRLLDFAKQRREADQRETQSILRGLLARSAKGEPIDLALCFRGPGGVERCLFTGPYKANPAEAVNAAMRMILHLAEIQDDA